MDKLPSPDPRPWREDLMRELARRKIPRAWQARLMEELDDHLSDLKEEMMSTTSEHFPSPEERLGKPHELAVTAATEYRRLGFFARRPVLTYFALPILATPLAFATFLLVTMLLMSWTLDGVEHLLESGQEPTASSVANGLVGATVFASRFVPFALLAAMFCWLACRHGRSWRCVLSACLVVAVYAAIFSVSLEYRSPAQPGSLMMGFALPPQQLVNYLQAAVPLAVGLLFVWRMASGQYSRSMPNSTSVVSA